LWKFWGMRVVVLGRGWSFSMRRWRGRVGFWFSLAG
jgi:hypothetical protein